MKYSFSSSFYDEDEGRTKVSIFVGRVALRYQFGTNLCSLCLTPLELPNITKKMKIFFIQSHQYSIISGIFRLNSNFHAVL